MTVPVTAGWTSDEGDSLQTGVTGPASRALMTRLVSHVV